MFKKILNTIKTSIWLYPTLYSLFALVLSFTTTTIDQNYSNEVSNYLFGLFYTSSLLAQTVLSIIAGAFITIATFTFSTTMIVLTMYSSQFTPRVVENFLNNETTMKSFGIFLSGFIYSITSLLFINMSQSDTLIIAASVGVIYVIVGLIYFIIFIHNVSTHIQANGLILRLQDEAFSKITDYRNLIEDSNIISERVVNTIIENKKKLNLISQNDGYIQQINYSKLQRIAQKHNFILCFQKVVGQYVTTEKRIITLYYDGDQHPDQEIIREIHECIWIGNKKTETQDFSFTIQKIVEIAMKALSPGVNDPNTAIHCLKIIGVLLRDLADIESGYVVMRDENENGFVLYEAYDFEILLYDTYQQIILYGKVDAAVMIGVFKSLRFSKVNASSKNIQLINDFAINLFDKLINNGYDPLDYVRISKEYNQLIEL